MAAVTAVVESGERVYLRHPRPADRAEFLTRARASTRLHTPWIVAPSEAEFDDYLGRAGRDNALFFLICRTADDAIVGVANVGEIVRGNFGSAYLGYYSFEPFGRQGYMTEGIRLVLRHVFAAEGLHRIEANIQPGNDRSSRLAERIGFRKEGFSPRYLKIRGRWRDHDRWAILAEEFLTLESRSRGASDAGD